MPSVAHEQVPVLASSNVVLEAPPSTLRGNVVRLFVGLVAAARCGAGRLSAVERSCV